MERRSFLKLLGAAGLAKMVDAALPFPALAYNPQVPSKETEPRILESTFLMYHEMTAPKLKSDVLSYIGRGYEPISLETLVDFFQKNIDIPPNLPTFLVTCDDALSSQYEAVLKATEEIQNQTGRFVPVVFFALTQFNKLPLPIPQIPGETPAYDDRVHKYMTKDQLVELIRRGHRVESHTVNHAYLPGISENARNAEIIEGERRIQALWDLAGVEKRYRAFAYPMGGYWDQTEVIKNIYDVAFSTNQTNIHSAETRHILGRLRA